jgi:hypothetical protein
MVFVLSIKYQLLFIAEKELLIEKLYWLNFIKNTNKVTCLFKSKE